MKTCAPALFFVLAASALHAEQVRQLEAHEHGVGQLDIAFDGDRIAMQLHAPGADIVGFEYVAESAEDRAKVDAAVATLARPLDLFVLPASAGCSVVQASASLESDADREPGHGAHQDDAHAHDHDHAEHKEEAHAAEVMHSEFHAEYLLRCADVAAASVISFAYFTSFPNAQELEVQVISDKGATAFEIGRDAPQLDLRDMF